MRMVLALAFTFVIVLAASGCTTSRYERAAEVQADLPSAIGLGAFASSCIFFCFITATFSALPTLDPQDATLRYETHRSLSVGPTKPKE